MLAGLSHPGPRLKMEFTCQLYRVGRYSQLYTEHHQASVSTECAVVLLLTAQPPVKPSCPLQRVERPRNVRIDQLFTIDSESRSDAAEMYLL